MSPDHLIQNTLFELCTTHADTKFGAALLISEGPFSMRTLHLSLDISSHFY